MATQMCPSPDQNKWADEFASAGLDVIPDPMVMRIADLFIGGRSFAREAKLDPDKVWDAIQQNLDALIVFFHLLMTRDRIPLIDYEYTFNTTNFGALGDIAVALHPSIYPDLKERAKQKLASLDIAKISLARRDELAAARSDELAAVGYDWFPEPGGQFAGSDKVLGTLLLGALIFGGYAQISGSDHVLQATRGKLLLELTQPDDAPLWVGHQEAKLFSRLNEVVIRDPRLSSREMQVPPTILPVLIQQGVTSPRHLLEKALDLRDKDADFIAYRHWYGELREAWARGTHREDREKDVVDTTKELVRRYPPGKDPLETRPMWSREIGIKATVGAEVGFDVGIAHNQLKADVEADLGQVTVSFPNWVRNWFVESIRFRSHRKILLQMALAQHNSDYLVLGLRKIWNAS